VTNKTGSIEIREYLKENGKLVNEFLEEYFDGRELDAPQVLKKSMRYSLLAGGKRLRPILALASYEACGGDPIDIIQPASALEVVHTYSLIHDDLPAMDDDDLRRGKPTNHKVFGEAMAILAGDALFTEAFLMITRAEGIGAERSLEAARELSLAAGARGMVGGQVQDILSENAEPDKETLSYIHTHKTGALIRASVRIGAILAGADNELLGALTSYGEKLGLAFQIIDDILDIKGDETVLGKPVGSDLENNKMTYPALYGLDASSERAGELIGEAIEALSPFSKKADTLREIARYVLKRKS
jgi:geranylgeranyl diphosphate synthase type II